MTAEFRRALEAFREGRKAPWSLPAPEAAQALCERYVLARLTPPDHVALARLAEARERALAMARAGRHDDARASMKLAAFLLSITQFSRDGRTYATTLHHAAESYLSFRRGNHSDARARMVAAIQTTDQLAVWWGDSEFIARRRVHLAHNLMRVDVARGATRDAMQLGTRLLECLAGVGLEGPFREWRTPVGALMDARQVEFYFDLVTQTAAELLAPLPVKEARDLFPRSLRMHGLGIRRPWRGWEWLAIKTAALGDDRRCFLERAYPFLGAGRGETPTLWYAVAVDLARAYCAVDPTPDLAPLEEIFAELAVAPRVPACMRAPRIAA